MNIMKLQYDLFLLLANEFRSRCYG